MSIDYFEASQCEIGRGFAMASCPDVRPGGDKPAIGGIASAIRTCIEALWGVGCRQSIQASSFGREVDMQDLTYDVFSGSIEKDARWIETAEGLSEATDLMKRLAAARPGPYFVYDLRRQKVLANIDTTGPRPRANK
jgi:hypothetical protein